MVRILGRESQHSIASKLLDVIPLKDYSLDVRAYTTILHVYSRTGKHKRAISVFERMKETGLSPTLVTYNVMLDVYGKMGRSWDKILGLLDEMRSNGLKFDEFTCRIYLEALSILKEMEDNNCPTDSVRYNELVAAYVRVGFYKEGAALIGTMMHKGVMPNAVTYTTVINAYGKAGEEEQALKLFDKMKESRCVPNVCTYNAVLGMLGKKSRSEEMIKILCDMKSSGCSPNRITWNTMLAMCGNTGMHQYINATKMYEEMIEVGFVPCATTYNALLNALARRGDWKVAESVILDMKNKGFRPNETSHSLMLQCYAKGGNVLLRTLVRANFKCGALVGMERAFQELLKRGYKPDLVLFNSMLSIFAKNSILMDMYARVGECWKAEEILKGLQTSGGNPDLVSYNTVIKGFCRQRHMQEALRILSEMTTRGIRPCIFTYNTFLAGYAAQGMFKEIDEVISYMIQQNCKPNDLTYKIVVDGYCKARNYKEAMDFVKQETTKKPWTFFQRSRRWIAFLMTSRYKDLLSA
ncbi:hypothetical protein SLEP1_g54905 [Rubroshorea leprosula]|uniref:Pentatricopeptide repeat-containing protein n=1 Tax=Rubroshorea leprosula TaxID=152421 RepID=A0AAV5MGD6_9ROSI|nr:hypothetical protein SLEP1_g54905 [Rubroshorea leprosula]